MFLVAFVDMQSLIAFDGIFFFLVHGFMENSTNLSVAEGDVQQVTISLDTKGNSLNHIFLTSISTFSFQITCLGSSSGGGLRTTSE